jgi:hypothetical protein
MKPYDRSMISAWPAALLSLMAVAAQASSPPALRIEIVFDGGLTVPRRVEASAMGEVQRIWAPYGVHIVRAERCDPIDRAVRLTVAIVDRAVSSGGGQGNALGAIRFVNDEPTPAITMYLDPIVRLVAVVSLHDRYQPEWPVAFNHVVVGRVLGRALAHEIGHFVLRSNQHASSGLMRAKQILPDLVSADRHRLGLSADETARLSLVIASFYQSLPASAPPRDMVRR